MIIKFPRRNGRTPKDEESAQRWRGALFEETHSTLNWREGESYEWLKRPGSVTFPICEFCRHIIWDWPHFEEEVPENAICEECFKEEEEANNR